MESDITAVFAAADMIPMPVGSENYSIGYDAAAAEDITQIVEMLLTKNSVDIQTVHGKTLLMYAAKRGNICLAERLIAMGCDVIIVDNQGKNAIGNALNDVENAFGEYHVDIGSGGFMPSYVTDDGYLITFSVDRDTNVVEHVGKTDLFSGESVEWYFLHETTD